MDTALNLGEPTYSIEAMAVVRYDNTPSAQSQQSQCYISLPRMSLPDTSYPQPPPWTFTCTDSVTYQGDRTFEPKQDASRLAGGHSLLYATDPFFPADIQQQLPERDRSRLVLTRATTKQGEEVSSSLASVLPNEELVKVQLDFETLLGNTNSVSTPQSDALANDVVFYPSMN